MTTDYRWPVAEPLEAALRELLQCGLWGRAPRPDAFCRLTAADWQALMALAEHQAVTGLCYPPLLQLPQACSPPATLVLQWYARTGYIEQCNRHLREVWDELNLRFCQAGIKVVLLKGIGVANWYARPLLRAPGDLDLYFPTDYDRAVETVRSWSVEVAYGDWHHTFDYKGVEVELHASFNHLAPKGVDIDTLTVGEGATRYLVPAPAFNAELLLVHPAFHLLKEGISIRYLCDWAMFLKTHAAAVDFDGLRKVLRRAGTGNFATVFTTLAVAYLGLECPGLPDSWAAGASPKQLRRLYRDMMATGNFGRSLVLQQPFDTLSLANKLRQVKKEVWRAAVLSPYCRKQARRFICHKLSRVCMAVLTGKEFRRTRQNAADKGCTAP